MRDTNAPSRSEASKRVRNDTSANRSIQIRVATDVRAFWLKVRDVPRRTEGRSKKQYERYYLGLYLLALGDHGLLRYPLNVFEGEKPDFTLVGNSGKTIGLEVTRATDEDLQAAMTRAETDHPDGQAIPPSPLGYVGDDLEKKWCAVVRQVVEKKLAKLPEYIPASRYDLMVPDDTRMGAGDRRKVMTILGPWARELKKREPKLGRISAAASLDILYDIGGRSLILPFIEWSSPESQDAAPGLSFSDRVEYGGQFAVKNQIERHKEAGNPVYSTDARGRLVKEMPDGHKFEVRVSETGEETTVRDLTRG